MNSKGFSVLLIALLGISIVITGCDSNKQSDESGYPASLVNTLKMQKEDIHTEQNLPGRVDSVREAVIIPRVNGIVLKRDFAEGTIVQKGQLLYQLDDGTYRAALSIAQASLAQATANREVDVQNLNRYKLLVASNAISRQTYDQAVADVKVQDANIAAAKADIEQAQINLGYTQIVAPITGLIGTSAVTEGAYVTASTTQMASIQQMDPIYIDITQSADDFLRLKKAVQSGEVKDDNSSGISLVLSDGENYPHKGKFVFANQVVNPSTGEVMLRVQFPNPEEGLLPGMYVRVILPQANYQNAYLVPQQAVIRGSKDTLYIAKDDGSFEEKQITVSGEKDNNWIITEGLQDGDQVIVEGLIAIEMGAKKVKIEPWKNPDNESSNAQQ